MMVVSPSLAKRTHLRRPMAAAFLRSYGVSKGFGVVVIVMSVPACVHACQQDVLKPPSCPNI